MHVHMLDSRVAERSRNKTVFTGFGKRPANAPRPGAESLLDRMANLDLVLEDLDERGIDTALVSASTVIQGTGWADPVTDAELCALTNDVVARWQDGEPERIRGSFLLPLQDIDASLTELRRSVDNGLRTVALGAQARGVYLGDPPFAPLWSAIAEHRLTAWIHPDGIGDEWFQEYALWNSIGQSIEEVRCMASIIYGGVLTRHPELSIVVAHGGGYFPHYLGRLDRNALNRPDTVRNTGGLPPSAFLQRFHYDSCVYDPLAFRSLVARVGVERIVLGSDYPVGEADPIGWLRSQGLTDDDVVAITSKNPARVLAIEPTVPVDEAVRA